MGYPRVDEAGLHERVLQGDPVAPVDVFQTYMEQILKILIQERGCDLDVAHDSAIDAVMSYLGEPGRYDPKKGRLSTYLIQVAKNRASDRHRAATAQARRDQDYAKVFTLQQKPPKEAMEDAVEARRLLHIVQKLLKREKDKITLEHYLQDERSTEVLAEALGLKNLTPEEQKREVKRHKDRLMKFLERFGKDEDELLERLGKDEDE
ncbi:sigma-70 family RNA polymerase sigma factor [Stigmatella sp. ncwal1]|uniref:Sigma-70 family RNA polymerase sigma factor n=1 Tax=Stigmatella ashevillensis TaxID=2995309 RepID=A0ABT5DJ07_9BACT|nr:sigma-70 family RNA polymerase sigma factor [Stigmatella ashevillena]MDC0713603.1 sigma-70 family RNA polymerase sigma factor [Stigmatella ashevillena]